MQPYYERSGIRLYHGDCREVVPSLDEQFAAVVTDPPYGLSFMGRDWDHAVPGVAFWEAFRDAMTPGGHLLAFGGTRVWHRLAVAIEDAGFDIKDTLMWLHGQGFPKHKSLLKPAWEPVLLARKPGPGVLQIDACRIGTTKDVPASASGRMGANGIYSRGLNALDERTGMDPNIGRWPPNVLLDPDAAAALDAMSGERPSKRKPQTTAGNASRKSDIVYGGGFGTIVGESYGDTGGASRFFPVLPIDDPDTLRFLYQAKASRRERNAGLDGLPTQTKRILNGGIPSAVNSDPRGMSGGGDRQAQNHHPTVKPLALMRWLLTLVTPPGGTVLDPFAGSGTTGVAAAALGIPCVLVEQEAEYLPIIAGRIDHALDARAGAELPLFAGVAD